MLKNARTSARPRRSRSRTYDALEAAANAAGDTKTAKLAADHRKQEERCSPTCASRSARARARQTLVEAPRRAPRRPDGEGRPPGEVAESVHVASAANDRVRGPRRRARPAARPGSPTVPADPDPGVAIPAGPGRRPPTPTQPVDPPRPGPRSRRRPARGRGRPRARRCRSQHRALDGRAGGSAAGRPGPRLGRRSPSGPMITPPW